MRKNLACLLFLLSLACSSQKEAFLIGMYGADEKTKTELKSSGFNAERAGEPAPKELRTPCREPIDFPNAGAAVMAHCSPVPHWPLGTVGQTVRSAQAQASNKEVWAVIQALTKGDLPKGVLDGPQPGRYPNWTELRFMSYDAIVAGAQALWYAAAPLDPSGNSEEYAEALEGLKYVAKEMRAMGPIFAHGIERPLPFKLTPGLEAKMWDYRGRDYLVITNPSEEEMFAAPPEVLASRWRALFGTRRDPKESLVNTKGAYYLFPNEVLVLESRLRFMRSSGL